jgi:segregation and condensation protein B
MSIEKNLLALLEAILLAAAKPLTVEQLLNLFEEEERPSIAVLRETLGELQNTFETRGIELIEVASGYRFQVKQKYLPWVSKLWDEKPQKYSRALLETLALIAYRQPVTRGEIEDIRGVAVSTSIFKTLLEDREWIRMVGHKEVPGRPALFATTKGFLDYFGLKSLQELPSLPDIMNLETVNADLLEQSLPSISEPEIESQLTEEYLEIAEMVEMEDVETQ